MSGSTSTTQVAEDIRRATCKPHSSEAKVRIAPSRFRGGESKAELRRKEGGGGAASDPRGRLPNEGSEALLFLVKSVPRGRQKGAREAARPANIGEVKSLRAEALALNERGADFSLERSLLEKKHVRARTEEGGGRRMRCSASEMLEVSPTG